MCVQTHIVLRSVPSSPLPRWQHGHFCSAPSRCRSPRWPVGTACRSEEKTGPAAIVVVSGASWPYLAARHSIGTCGSASSGHRALLSVTAPRRQGKQLCSCSRWPSRSRPRLGTHGLQPAKPCTEPLLTQCAGGGARVRRSRGGWHGSGRGGVGHGGGLGGRLGEQVGSYWAGGVSLSIPQKAPFLHWPVRPQLSEPSPGLVTQPSATRCTCFAWRPRIGESLPKCSTCRLRASKAAPVLCSLATTAWVPRPVPLSPWGA